MSQTGASATMFYLLTYGMATIGAFAILTVVRRGDGGASHVADWAGMARKFPVLAASMSLFLLSFAGIPLTAGFIGKLSVFTAAMQAGLGLWVVLAMIATAITAFFYLRIVVVMYFADPAKAAQEAPVACRRGRRRRRPRPGPSGPALAGGGRAGHRRPVRGRTGDADDDRDRRRGDPHAGSRPVPGPGAGPADHPGPAAVVTGSVSAASRRPAVSRSKPDIGSSV